MPCLGAEVTSHPSREPKVAVADRRTILRVAATVLAFSGVALALPSLAEAQSRGTLQATATVVDVQPSLHTLDVAHAALSHWMNPGAKRTVDVTTLAQVSVNLQTVIRHKAAEPAERQAPAVTPTLVVRIDYLNN